MPQSTLADVALLGNVVTSFAEYVDTGGGRGLEVALGATPEAVIDEVAKSGLRGRGGAGFPTGEKWRSIRTTGTGTRFAVCNGAEGEPATFKDRALMRTNPYQILEGLAIAGHAIGAERCYIGIKDTFTGGEIAAISRAVEGCAEDDTLSGRWLRGCRWAGPLCVQRGDRPGGGDQGPAAAPADGGPVDARVLRLAAEKDDPRWWTTSEGWAAFLGSSADGPGSFRSISKRRHLPGAMTSPCVGTSSERAS